MRRLFVFAVVVVGGYFLLTMAVEESSTTPPVAAPPAADEEGCAPFVELMSAEDYARELGRSEAWVLSEYRINLWSKTTPHGRGSATGRMIPGSRARILNRMGSDYFVRSPLDGSAGWINEVQISREILQDPRTNRICANQPKG